MIRIGYISPIETRDGKYAIKYIIHTHLKKINKVDLEVEIFTDKIKANLRLAQLTVLKKFDDIKKPIKQLELL
jgi:hypothetical protein